MAKKSKKQLVFALFAEGKRPQDQELKDLGIKSHTLYNCHQQFKKKGSTSEDYPRDYSQRTTPGTTTGTTTGVVTAPPTSTTSCSRKMVVPQRTTLRVVPQ